MPSIDIAASADGQRQWAHVRRFYIDRRQNETDFVTERLHNYRDVVEDLVNGLRQIGQRDQNTESSVKKNLDVIEKAVDVGQLPQIKAAVDETVKNITETFAKQKEEYEGQIKELNDRMSSLRQIKP